MIMVCDKCDPKKLRRYDGVEKRIIDLPVIDVGSNESVGWETKKCKFCGQHFNVHTTNKEFDILKE